MIQVLLFFALLSAGGLLISYGMPGVGKGPQHLLAWLAGWAFVVASVAASR